MTIGEILRNLGTDAEPSRRNQAVSELDRLLEELVRIPFCLKNGRPFTVEEAHREDVIADVRLKLVEKAAAQIAHKEAPVCRLYIRKMIRNRWIDILRDRARERVAAGGPGEEDCAPEESFSIDPVSAIHERWVAEQFEILVEAHIASKQARYQEATRRAWKDLKRVLNEGVETEELVDERVGPDAPQAERIRARDAFFQQSKRLREGIYLAIESFLANGRYDETQAEQMRSEVLRLLRCQKHGTSGVSGVKGNPMTAPRQIWQRKDDHVSTGP